MLKAEAAWGEAMGLFNLFGGKKNAAKTAAKGPEHTTSVARQLEEVDAKAAAPPSRPVAGSPAAISAPAAATQVKLRLRMAASLRAGELGKAYEAAKGLADIQAKAGRRVGARVWAVEAERILAAIPKAA